MNNTTEFMILDIIRKNASIMPLFRSGYSYSKIMEWTRRLEREGKVVYNESGYRELTEEGRCRWKTLKKKRERFVILPLQDYKVPQLEIDEAYLP